MGRTLGRVCGEQVPQIADGQVLSPADPGLRIGIDTQLLDEFSRTLDELREAAVGFQKILAARPPCCSRWCRL
jgi:hypothetical protein